MIGRSQLLALAGALVVCGVLTGGVWWARKRAERVTFATDIAPIVFAKCAPCHRPGEAGPFSLLTYEDVSRRARQIKNVTGRRFMPPWKPVAGYAEYSGDRSLTPAQIDRIRRWVDEGAPLGDPADMPATPKWPSGWRLGEPDVVVQMTEAYDLAAGGTDVYRNFVIPSPVSGLRYVKAWDFRPGTRVIHHAILNIDRLGIARQRDAEDPGQGFGGMDVGNVQSADGFYLVWAPGKVPAAPDPRMAWRLDEHTDLVLQLHMQPRGKEESVRPTIGLYFSDRPPTIPLFSLRVGDPPIDIPPGEKSYMIHADYALPADVDVLSLFPHAHYLAKKMRSWATLPDHSERGLLLIDAWDFNWQDSYTFAEPISLPAGSVISMEFVYDNSADNIRNPSHPPKRVVTGERSTDEMGNITFEVAPHDAKGLVRLRASKYERALAGQDTARNQYNLANALADDGRADDAIAHYRRAIEDDPKFAPALFNLANLLLAKGDADGAILGFRQALQANPGLVSARINLGHALEAKGQLPAAIAEYREAVAAEPRSALAHGALGLALARNGDRAGAAEQLRAALTADPGSREARMALDALVADGGADDGSVGR